MSTPQFTTGAQVRIVNPTAPDFRKTGTIAAVDYADTDTPSYAVSFGDYWRSYGAGELEPVHTFTTIRIAPLLDHLCNAVDAARAKAAGDRRWLNAIDAAWDWLLRQEMVSYDPTAHALRVESASESGKVYEANGDCGCTAFARTNACWHRAAARLVRRALEGQSLADVAALRGELYEEALEQGVDWTEAQDAMDAASALLPALHAFAAAWDAAAAHQKAAALSARIGAAQAAAMTRAA